MTSDWVKVGTNKIHRTAILENVNLGQYNTVGPYSVLLNAEIGDKNIFTAHCVVGAEPEIRNWDKASQKVWIGHENVFREFVTVNCGSVRLTKIGSRNVFFQKSHVSHDAEVMDNVTVCGQSCIGGHCIIEPYVTLGGDVHLHQFVMIGLGAMIGQGAMVTRHVRPFQKIAAIEGRVVGDNDYILDKMKWDKEKIVFERMRFEKKYLREVMCDDRKRRPIHE